jgi:hypothetical protein
MRGGSGAGFENAVLSAGVAFDPDAGFRAGDTVGDIGSGVGRGGIEPEGLIHQDAKAAVAAHQNGEFVRTVRSCGGGDVKNPSGVFEETLHSKDLSAEWRQVRVFFRTAISFEYPRVLLGSR